MNVHKSIQKARALLPPLKPWWRTLAFYAASAWDEYDEYAIVMGNGPVTVTDFLDGRQEVTFAWGDVCGAVGEFADPRYGGMMFAIHALFPCNSHPTGVVSAEISMEHAQSITDQLYIKMDSDDITGVVADGLENQGWEFCRDIAAKWLRVWCSAARIQRWWRMRRLNHRAPLWVPRLVSLLTNVERRQADPLLLDAALGTLMGV